MRGKDLAQYPYVATTRRCRGRFPTSKHPRSATNRAALTASEHGKIPCSREGRKDIVGGINSKRRRLLRFAGFGPKEKNVYCRASHIEPLRAVRAACHVPLATPVESTLPRVIVVLALTYTTPFVGHVPLHGGTRVDNARPVRVNASTLECACVVAANGVVELDDAC